jgi:probable F420-dependent oxidoreductase
MNYGVHLGNFGAAVDPASIISLAAAAERFGYDSVWVSDHIVTPEVFESQYPYPGTVFTPETGAVVFEPLTTLAYVAGATQRVRVGTSVLVVPQRNPLIMAKQIATLDALSGGRVEIGVGSGWMREEFELLGASFEERGPVLDEYLALWQKLWSEAIPEFHGRFVDLPECRFGPLPAQSGGPPISIGGNTSRSLRRAASGGWGWHAFRLAPEDIGAKINEFRSYWQDAGRQGAELRVLMRCHVDLSMTAADFPAGQPPWWISGPHHEATESIAAFAAAGVTDLIVTPAPGKGVSEGISALEEFAASFISSDRAAPQADRT